MVRFAALVLLILSFLGSALARAALDRHPIVRHHDAEQRRELLFIPSSSLARTVSLGYRNALADLLWFKTIAYFGAHIEGDRNVSRLDTLCSTIVGLNPKAEHVAVFCAQMLAWELKRPERAHRILSVAIEHSRANWMLYYLRGFFSLHFLNDTKGATEDLAKAASLPDCHPVVKRLAAKNIASLAGPQSALSFINIFIATETDPQTKRTLERRRAELLAELSAKDSGGELPREENKENPHE